MKIANAVVILKEVLFKSITLKYKHQFFSNQVTCSEVLFHLMTFVQSTWYLYRGNTYSE